MEIVYNDLDNQWKAYMPVECEALHQSKGDKKAFVDLGLKCPIVANIEGETFGYKANSMLADCGFEEENSMASGRVAKLEAHRVR